MALFFFSPHRIQSDRHHHYDLNGRTFLCPLDEQSDDRLSFPDFLALVHEYWVSYDDEKQQLQDAFDILDPQNKSKLMVDEFVHLLKNCDWPDEEIDLLLSQVSCADGYFLHDGNEYSIC